MPINIEDERKPVFIENPETGEAKATFNNIIYKTDHALEENPNWSTPENPAGVMISMGKITVLPQSCVFLSVIVSTPYEEDGKPHEYFYGNAE